MSVLPRLTGAAQPDQQPPRKPSCPMCWSTRHQCIRDPNTSDCAHCKRHNSGVVDESIAWTPSFSTARAHFQIYKGAPRGSLQSLDTAHANSSNLTVYVTIAKKGMKTETKPEVSRHCICILGLFRLTNERLVLQLDDMVRDTFAVRLSARQGTSLAIGNAILAGGYLHLLCSTTSLAEETNTWQDTRLVENDFQFNNLGLHLKDIVISRLKVLVEDVLNALRYIHILHHEFYQDCCERYAAAAILRHEMFYFGDRLRCGTLALEHHLSPDLKLLLVEWFSSVERELTTRIRLYCGRYPDWQTNIQGSLKNSRRKGETISLALRLDNYHVSSPISSEDGIFEETSDTASPDSGISPGWLS